MSAERWLAHPVVRVEQQPTAPDQYLIIRAFETPAPAVGVWHEKVVVQVELGEVALDGP